MKTLIVDAVYNFYRPCRVKLGGRVTETAPSKSTMTAPQRRAKLHFLVGKYGWEALPREQRPRVRKSGCTRWPADLRVVDVTTTSTPSYVDGVDPEEQTSAGAMLRLAMHAAATARTDEEGSLSQMGTRSRVARNV